jgi:cytochrome c oxidase cbb3-type subunit 4
VDIAQLQAYGYFALTALLVVILYAYIYHLYSSQKKGTRDYEKYGNMALHDDITDELVEEKEQKKKKEEA